MPIQNPRDLFVYGLSSALAGEQTTLQMVPQMERECKDPQIKQLYSDVSTNLQRHITRIQECFRSLGVQPMNVPCYITDGFQRDWQQFMQQGPSPDIIDLYSLGLAAELGHFKLGAYKNLVEMSRGLGQTQCTSSLEDTLHEKESTVKQTEQHVSRIGSQVFQRMRP